MSIALATMSDTFIAGANAAHIVGGEAMGHRLFEMRDVRGHFFVETDEDMRADDLRVNRNQAAAGRIEIAAHVRGMAQAAVEIVGPLVIRADQHADG